MLFGRAKSPIDSETTGGRHRPTRDDWSIDANAGRRVAHFNVDTVRTLPTECDSPASVLQHILPSNCHIISSIISMAPRTRAKPKTAPAPAEEGTPEPPTSTAKPLPPPTTNPPKLFVLPKDTSSDSRIVTLENPANGAPSRYYFCPNKGFHEFTCIAAPRKECKSWLITPERAENGAKEDSTEIEATKEEDNNANEGLGSGYVASKADIFLATPIDILFLILPALAPKKVKGGEKQRFLAVEDHLDALASISRQWKELLAQYPSLKDMIEQRMISVCDTAAAGDETMYRLSNEKLASIMMKKAERMCAKGLPPSMEERFIKTVLNVPIMNIQRSDVVTSTTTTDPQTDSTEAPDTQSTTVPTLARTESSLSTTTTSDSQSTTLTSFTSTPEQTTKPSLETPPEIPHLLRLRTSLTYLSTSYLLPSLRPAITSLPTPDFSPLDAHLSQLDKLRAEAQALRSISDNISRKRGFADDEGAAMEREEKKRKKEEEEKKKKGESMAIKKLKKVDTRGMMKLSAFFTKKT